MKSHLEKIDVKVVVFGATGKTGREVLKQALLCYVTPQQSPGS
jgi:hypothetical protein